jgi:hypothetical protein
MMVAHISVAAALNFIVHVSSAIGDNTSAFVSTQSSNMMMFSSSP